MLTVNRLSHADALILIHGAREKAYEIGVPMCISVVDESGNLIAFERMDGAKAHSILISQDKAYTGGAARKADEGIGFRYLLDRRDQSIFALPY